MKKIKFFGKSNDSSPLFPETLELNFLNITHLQNGNLSMKISEEYDLWIAIPQQLDSWGEDIMGWLFHSGTESARYYNFEIILE